MALRDQPYIPLFVQDFMTDEKLVECSAAATGVYIRIMCLMHKEEQYGKILLKQKYKQTGKQISDFATQLAGKMPYPLPEIEAGLEELLNEKVVHFDGDFLCQKRMIEDNDLSLKRSKSGKKGGKAKAKKEKEFSAEFATDFAKAKNVANTEYEYESEYVNENAFNSDRGTGKDLPIVPRMVNIFRTHFPHYPIDQKKDFTACCQIADKIADANGWPPAAITNGKMEAVIGLWEEIVVFAKADKWFSTRSIFDLNNEYQRLIQAKNGTKTGNEHRRTARTGIANGFDPTVIEREGFGGPR